MSFSIKKSTGSGALAVTLALDPISRYILEQVRLTVDSKSPKVETFTCTLDSAAGSEYDVQLIKTGTQDMKSLICSFDDENKFEKNDELVFAWENSDGKTWGLEIRYTVTC